MDVVDPSLRPCLMENAGLIPGVMRCQLGGSVPRSLAKAALQRDDSQFGDILGCPARMHGRQTIEPSNVSTGITSATSAFTGSSRSGSLGLFQSIFLNFEVREQLGASLIFIQPAPGSHDFLRVLEPTSLSTLKIRRIEGSLAKK